MPQTALPNLGLDYDWTLGVDGWKTGMDDNLALLDALAMPFISVAFKSVSAEPGAPSNGAAYIIGASPSGASWGASPSMEDWYAVYYSGTGWHFAEPRDGWRVKDRTTGLWYEYYNAQWNLADLTSFIIACSDLITPLSASTDVAFFRAPFPFEIVEAQANVLSAAAGSPAPSSPLNEVLVDVNLDGASIFGANKLRILGGNLSSEDESPLFHTLSTTTVTKNQLLTIDIDSVPGVSPGALGLQVLLVVARISQ